MDLTVAVCSYNRAPRLADLLVSLASQATPAGVLWEILVVDNNSSDRTAQVVAQLAAGSPVPIRYLLEPQQGIVPARNRAIDEAAGSYLAFIDDDEVPGPRWLQAAWDALDREGADCAGGAIRVRLPDAAGPGWLGGELLGFLGEVDYRPEPFWVESLATPVWTGNVAYRRALFSDGLRFDRRYNREGDAPGGGEDFIMFRTLLERGARIRYRPDMMIEHLVEPFKLRRSHFLQLHFAAGRQQGRWGAGRYGRSCCGIPLFMVSLALRQLGKTLLVYLNRDASALRQAMNASHAFGMIAGRLKRWQDERAVRCR